MLSQPHFSHGQHPAPCPARPPVSWSTPEPANQNLLSFSDYQTAEPHQVPVHACRVGRSRLTNQERPPLTLGWKPLSHTQTAGGRTFDISHRAKKVRTTHPTPARRDSSQAAVNNWIVTEAVRGLTLAHRSSSPPVPLAQALKRQPTFSTTVATIAAPHNRQLSADCLFESPPAVKHRRHRCCSRLHCLPCILPTRTHFQHGAGPRTPRS